MLWEKQVCSRVAVCRRQPLSLHVLAPEFREQHRRARRDVEALDSAGAGTVILVSAAAISSFDMPSPSAPSTSARRCGSGFLYNAAPSRGTVARILNPDTRNAPATSSPARACATRTLSAPPSATRNAAPGKSGVRAGKIMPATPEVRRAAQNRTNVVRIADAVEPDEQCWFLRRTGLQQFRHCDRHLPAQFETDAFVMLRIGQSIEVVGFYDAIAETMLHAPSQHRFEIGDARLGQINLAQILRSPRERSEARVASVNTHFIVVAPLRPLERRIRICARARRGDTYRSARRAFRPMRLAIVVARLRLVLYRPALRRLDLRVLPGIVAGLFAVHAPMLTATRQIA